MDRLEAMRIFVTVAEERGFARAAKKLSLSAPVVTRAISALEERLGARLLHRTTRSVRPTEAGSRFLLDAKRILTELELAEGTVADTHGQPRGQLVVTAPLMFGRMHVAPILLEFLSRHAQVTARALFSDQIVDLMDEEVDVAVRIGKLPPSNLKSIRVGVMRRIVCASPEYLARHGTPSSPEDLSGHQLIGFIGISAHKIWTFGEQKSDAFRPAPRLTVNTADVAVQAALGGHGLTRLLSYQAASELAQGKLKRVLVKFEPPPVPVHVVHAEGRQAPARVREFVELAVERLRALNLK